MEIIYAKAAVRALESMDKAAKRRIYMGIMGLTQTTVGGYQAYARLLRRATSASYRKV